MRSSSRRSGTRSTGEGGLRDVSDHARASGHVGADSVASTSTSSKREPWALAKRPDAARDCSTRRCTTPPTRLRVIAALIDPVMPEAAERIRGMLGIAQESWTDSAGRARCGRARGSAPIEPLFPRIEKTVEELRGMTTANDRRNAAATAPRRKPDQRRPRDDTPHRSHRRLHEGRAARGEGARGRGRAEVEEAAQAEGRCRHRAADDRRGHRRGLSAGSARRPHHRHRRQPEAGEADGRSSRTGWCSPPAPRAACRRSLRSIRRSRPARACDEPRPPTRRVDS